MLKIMQTDDSMFNPPTRKYPSDAGLDIYAHENAILYTNRPVAVRTGFAMSIPEGYVAQICTRSGMALKNIVVNNAPGIIDSNFCGEVKVILVNRSNAVYEIKKGDRIAQMVIFKIELWNPKTVLSLDETDRGSNGFGSTGV